MLIEMITETLVRSILPPRDADTSKRDYGTVLVIAGSEGMMGAAVLCAEAALRGGAGLVTLCCPREFFAIPQTSIPEAMCVRRDYETLTPEKLNSYSAIAFGPGMGRGQDVAELLKFVMLNYQGTLVLDADGLNALAADPSLADGRRCKLILTPHCAEAARLLAWEYEQVAADKAAAAEELSRRYGATAVVKGHGTVVCLEGGRMFVNTTGNPGMATGGAGDVLTGLMAALAGQQAARGADTSHAAVAAVWLHGKAGDIAAHDFGEYSLIAGDITTSFSLAFPEDC